MSEDDNKKDIEPFDSCNCDNGIEGIGCFIFIILAVIVIITTIIKILA